MQNENEYNECNENEFELDGVTYIAKPAIGCTGCEFQNGHPNCQATPECSGSTRTDANSVIFIKKPEYKPKTEKEDKMQATKQYDVADKSKEYWEIICAAYKERGAEVFIPNTKEWITAYANNPKRSLDWLNYDWRIKPKNRVVTLEIPEDLEFSYDFSPNWNKAHELHLYFAGEKEILQKIVESFQKS